MSFQIKYEKLLKKYKTIWTKVEDLQNTELNTLSVYDNRYVKSKTRTYGDKVQTNFLGLNVQEDDIECKSFIVISTHACISKQILPASIFRQLHSYNYRQIILMTIILKLIKIRSYKCCIMIALI